MVVWLKQFKLIKAGQTAVVCLTAFLHCSQLLAGSTLDLHKNTHHYPLAESFEYFEDIENQFDIERILVETEKIEWIDNTGKATNFGFNSNGHWFHIRIKNRSYPTGKWLISNSYTMVDLIEFYLVKNNKVPVPRVWEPHGAGLDADCAGHRSHPGCEEYGAWCLPNTDIDLAPGVVDKLRPEADPHRVCCVTP